MLQCTRQRPITLLSVAQVAASVVEIRIAATSNHPAAQRLPASRFSPDSMKTKSLCVKKCNLDQAFVGVQVAML